MTHSEARRVLQVEQNASLAHIRQSYLDLVKVWHPDRFHLDDRLREKAVHALQEINEAYAVLSGGANGSARSQRSQSRSTAPDEAAPEPSAEPRPTSASEPEPERGRAARFARRRFDRPLVTAALVGCGLGVALAFFLIVRSSAPASADVMEPPATPVTADVELVPDAPRARTAPAPAFSRPESGTDIGSAGPTGRGALSIRNDTATDAVVVFRGENGLRRALYLREGEKLTVLDLAASVYTLRVMLGSGWAARSFAKVAGYLERDEPVAVAEARVGVPIDTVVVSADHRGFRSVPAFRID